MTGQTKEMLRNVAQNADFRLDQAVVVGMDMAHCKTLADSLVIIALEMGYVVRRKDPWTVKIDNLTVRCIPVSGLRHNRRRGAPGIGIFIDHAARAMVRSTLLPEKTTA